MAFTSALRMASHRVASEDRVELIESGEALVVAVADGAGGVQGGAVAAESIVDAVRRRTREHPCDPYDLRAWTALLNQADEELARSPGGGETTAIVVVVGAHGVVGVSAGDSEVWMVSHGRADRLTERQNRVRLGNRRCVPTSFYRRAVEGILIAGTDGLFRHAAARSIVACCSASKDVDEIADSVVALPKSRSGGYPDDVAIAIVGTSLTARRAGYDRA